VASGRKRAYGTGSVIEHGGVYYGKWRSNGRQIKRKLGPVRAATAPHGLTRKEAEKRLREQIATVRVPELDAGLSVADVGARYLLHLEHVMQRKRTTVQDYRIILERHLAPFFGSLPVARIGRIHLERYMTGKRASGLAVKTVTNHLNFAHGLFAFALKRGWVAGNPVALVDRPVALPSDPDIRFLDREELESLLRAALQDRLGPTDHAIWIAAAMTGLRQGELAALRWRDIDWVAGVIRVRRSFSRGQWSTPKSRRSSRAVPMADRVAAELERHFARSAYQHDDDLVFCHPDSGRPYDASTMRVRFKQALQRAGLRKLRFQPGGVRGLLKEAYTEAAFRQAAFVHLRSQHGSRERHQSSIVCEAARRRRRQPTSMRPYPSRGGADQ